MKTLTRLFILLFVMAGVSSCYTGIPLKQGKSENNQTTKSAICSSMTESKSMDLWIWETMCTLPQREM